MSMMYYTRILRVHLIEQFLVEDIFRYLGWLELTQLVPLSLVLNPYKGTNKTHVLKGLMIHMTMAEL